MAKKAKPQSVTVEYTLDGLLSDAHSELEELGNEMREAFDNMPENLQGSSIGEARDDCANALESLSQPELPKPYADMKISYTSFPLKPKATRNDRRNAALDKIDEVLSFLQNINDDLEEKDDNKEELESFLTDLESYKDEADAIDFPGMRG